MLTTHGFMLDTCTINRIHDGEVTAGEWTLRGPIYITGMRRDSLLSLLFGLRPSVIGLGVPPICSRTCQAGYDFAHDDHDYLNSCELSQGRMVPVMAAMLGRNPGKLQNRLRDALITESTRANGLILVTSDRRLAIMARSFGLSVEAIQ
jgi:hypothetical protein